MAKGENIFKRKDGRWEARYVKGRRLDGTIQYGFCYGKTYKEAKQKCAEKKAAVLLGQSVEGADRHRLGQYCDEWLEVNREKVKESTYTKYASIVRKHIKPRLGCCHLQSIQPEVIAGFTRMLMEQMSPKSTRDTLAVLHSVLKYAGCNVEIPYPKEPRREMRVLSTQEQRVLVERLLGSGERKDLGILLALLTGMRIGELCALRWEDISLGERTIHIRSTMQRLCCEGEARKTKIIITEPKSDKSRRFVPMTAMAVSVCQRLGPGVGFVLILLSPELCSTDWSG